MSEKRGLPLLNRLAGSLALPIASVLVALLIAAVLIAVEGKDPWAAFRSLYVGAFGNLETIASSVATAVPLTLAALGVAFAFRAGVFNIGGPGQIYLGAVAATLVGTRFPGLSIWVHLPLALLAGFLAGGLYAVIPGTLKVQRGFNEVILTILMNYLAINFVSYLLHGPMKDPAANYPQSELITPTARLPQLMKGTELHGGLFLMIVGAIALYWILDRTVLGYQVRAVGGNPQAARYGGIAVGKIIIVAMLISGGLSGLAGSSMVLGTNFRLLETFALDMGYDAIAVALLGRLNPVGVVLAGLFFGALRNSANVMQIMNGIPVTLIQVIQAVVILCVLAGSYVQWKPFIFKGRRGVGRAA
ncbi:MAG: ABC transporter permease [Firmicutes bacterium]|nr:ABC transporter permease [Bacillota bacterium]